MLRITNILRRAASRRPPRIEQIVFGPFTFQSTRGELKRGGEPLKLTDREQRASWRFSPQRAGETIPRHEFLPANPTAASAPSTCRSTACAARSSATPSNPVWLQTVRGIGYRLSVE